MLSASPLRGEGSIEGWLRGVLSCLHLMDSREKEKKKQHPSRTTRLSLASSRSRSGCFDSSRSFPAFLKELRKVGGCERGRMWVYITYPNVYAWLGFPYTAPVYSMICPFLALLASILLTEVNPAGNLAFMLLLLSRSLVAGLALNSHFVVLWNLDDRVPGALHFFKHYRWMNNLTG
jgi:hypothetical protein